MKKKQQAHPLQPFTYDQNGDTLSDGVNTYQWDAENRLITINYPGSGNFTSFTYDGWGNRVQIVETTGGTITSTKQFIFAQGGMCEVRDSSGSTILNRFYRNGETIGGAEYFLTYDYLGSIREMADASGTIQAQYSYDIYGQVIREYQNVTADFQYAGYYNHQRSALSLTLYRPYNAGLGRWLSRDLVQSTSAYDYAQNAPIAATDPLGLCVTATYSQARHTFAIADKETGQVIVCNNIFSGNGFWANQPWAQQIGGRGPLPAGPYVIERPVPIPDHEHELEYPLTPGFPTTRGGFTIHPGRRSNGCVTFISDIGEDDAAYPHSVCFDKVKEMLNKTKECKCTPCKGKLGTLEVTH